MLKKILVLTILSLTGLVTFGQHTASLTADSLTIVKAKWHRQKVAPGLKLITFHFNKQNLFSGNENISYLEIKNNGHSPVLALGGEQTLLKTTSTFGTEHQAIAAINGSFFDVKKGGSVDFIKIDGKVLSNNTLNKDNSRARHQQSALLIKNGKLSLVKWDGTRDWEHTLTAGDVLLTGPLLTYNGTDQQLDTSAFIRLRHPRTSIGIKPNGNIIFLTVDGRSKNSAGMNLAELTKTMRWLGCTSAVNLDGGGSSTLWVRGFPAHGVINYPTDNKKWDHEGERKVANVILIKSH